MPWITKQKPDADLTVLMRLNDDEFPIWHGFWDGECWRNSDATEVEPGKVIGWMDPDDAAAALDRASLPDPLDEALNSGDGGYRP